MKSFIVCLVLQTFFLGAASLQASHLGIDVHADLFRPRFCNQNHGAVFNYDGCVRIESPNVATR